MGRAGCILAEGEMCSSLVVIIGVGVEDPTQVGFAERSRLPVDAKDGCQLRPGARDLCAQRGVEAVDIGGESSADGERGTIVRWLYRRGAP